MSRSRKQPLTSIRDTLALLRPGEATYFPRPARQPGARDLYLRINGCAYRLWGAGRYRLRGDERHIEVIRKHRGLP